MEILERDRQLDLVSTQFKRVSSGHGEVVLVSGEAGIGKTTFVQEVTKLFRQQSRVLQGACDPLFTPRSLGAVHDIALVYLPQLLPLFKEGVDWLAIASEFRKILFESRIPTILIFEDIHWADEATLDLIKYLARRLHQSKTLLILTYREDETFSKQILRSFLGDLPSAITTRLKLEPLSEQAIKTMADKFNRSPEGIFEKTRGNPFFVTEILRNESNEIPLTIRDAILTRVSHLSDDSQRLLELASIMPGAVEYWFLLKIFHPDPTSIDSCIDCGFLISNEDRISFQHELTRQAIEDSLSLWKAKELHSAVLHALQSNQEDEIDLARFVHHATRAADADMVRKYGPLAAKQASQHGAHREAARFFQEILRHSDQINFEEKAHLLDQLSFEQYLTGDIAQAIQTRQNATDLYLKLNQLLRVGDNLRWLSRLFWFQGNKKEAEKLAIEAINILDAFPPGKELALAYSNRSQLHMLSEENEEAIVWGKKALELADSLQDMEIFIHALTNISTAQFPNDRKLGQEGLEKALQMARKMGMHDHVARCYANLVTRTIQIRDYQSASQYLEEGLAYTTEFEMDSYRIYLLGWRARFFFEKGDWVNAEGDAKEVIRLQPGAAVIALPGITILGHLKARQGDPQASYLLNQLREIALPTGEFQRIGPAAVALAEAAWWNGLSNKVTLELEPAYRVAHPFHDDFQLGAMQFWTWKVENRILVESEIPLAYRLMISGDWCEAANEWERIGCPFEQALALSEGDIDGQLRALEIFEMLGASPAVKMVREKLKEQGVKGLPRGPRASTRLNPHGLTEREMDILACVEQGLSDAEIAKRLTISTKTVGHHVSAILAKLQVRSRSEAAAFIRQTK